MLNTDSIIFVGGPGRSGTSFVADRLGRHPEICAFQNIELKLFTEKNGLIDLQHALVESYSPNRATVALQQFSRFFEALVEGRFGQQALASVTPRDRWFDIRDAFLAELCQHGQAGWTTMERFQRSVRTLLLRIVEIAVAEKDGDTRPTRFLEKTPHALLAPEFLTGIAPGCALMHVMRDPRSVAFSLRAMPWGPTTIEACCAWVANYCAAWLRAQSVIANLGLRVKTVQIEMLATAPERSGELICAALRIKPSVDLFRGAKLEILNGWTDRCSDNDLRTLDSRLGGWAEHFGYVASKVGHTASPAENHAA